MVNKREIKEWSIQCAKKLASRWVCTFSVTIVHCSAMQYVEQSNVTLEALNDIHKYERILRQRDR